MTDPPAEGSPSPIDRPLRDLLDDQRLRDAAAARRRAHWLGAAAAEEGGLAGILVDLGERGQSVVVGIRGGHRIRGQVVAVGPEVVEVRGSGGAEGQTALVALAAVETVRPGPDAVPTVGARSTGAGPTLHDLLTGHAAGRPEVVVRTLGGDAVAGQLRAVGSDVLTVWGTADRSAVHVPLPAVAAVLLA